MNVRPVLLALVLAVLCGCEVGVPFDPAGDPPPAALSGAFSPDSLWRLRLIAVTPYGAGAPVPYLPPVEGAEVRVSDLTSGAALTLTDAGGGLYLADEMPRAGHRYAVEAVLPGGGVLRAQGEAPAPPTFSVGPTEAIGRSRIGSTDFGLYRTALTVGPARSDESLAVEALRTDGAPDASLFPVFFTSDDPELRATFSDDGPVRVYTEYPGRAVYLDPLASSRTVTVILRVPLVGAPPAVRIRVTGLSADLRRHLATTDVQNDRGGSPFVEPVRVFSNVEGGAGVFAGYVSRDTLVSLPPPTP